MTTIQRPERTVTYSVPSSAMEPTLHCARPEQGCEAATADRIEAKEPARDVKRGDVVVFETPPLTRARCGAGGIFVSRLIGLPGERLELHNEGGSATSTSTGRSSTSRMSVAPGATPAASSPSLSPKTTTS